MLRPLAIADEREAWEAHDELAREGFDFLHDGRRDDWSGYLARLADERAGVDLPPGYVPATFLVADVEGTAQVRAWATGQLRGVPPPDDAGERPRGVNGLRPHEAGS